MNTLKGVAVKGKRVLLRADLDIDVGKDGALVSDLRIKALLPSLAYLVANHARVIILAHWGRPKGQVVEELRLQPQFRELQKYYPDLQKATDCVGEEVEGMTRSLTDGGVLLLENLRFHSGEEANDPEFIRQLSLLGDIYVNDAFAVCHRDHASIVGLPSCLPAYAGIHLEQEVENLSRILQDPARPFVAVLSGVKAEKVPVVSRLAQVADTILLAGTLPQDANCPKGENIITPLDGEVGLDIGEKTINKYKEILRQAKTILWNGALGKYEDPNYERGTREIATFIANLPAYTIAGGGSTLGALSRFRLMEKINFVSTGGGSMLELLSGKCLPGLEALG